MLADYLYPGNPRKRSELSELRADIITTFSEFKNSWNKVADVMTDLLHQNSKTIIIRQIVLDIKKNPAQDCVEEIRDVVGGTMQVLKKVVEDIGLTNSIENIWTGQEIDIDNIGDFNALHWARAGVFLLNSVGSYILTDMAMQILAISKELGVGIIRIVKLVTQAAVNFTVSILIGAVTFTVIDLVFESAFGAIERSQLENALAELSKFNSEIKPNLQGATVKLMGISQKIISGCYKIDKTTYIINNKIVKLSPP